MGNDQIDQILKLTKLLGAKEVVTYIKEYKLSERRSHRKDNICFDIIVAFDNGDIKAEEPSTYYKAPELYFTNTQYDYRVDCWAAGMILAGMVWLLLRRFSRRPPF